MPTREGDDDWNDAEDEVDDPPEEDDVTIPCPHCGKAIYDEAERCPYCESYISKEDRGPTPKAWWVLVGLAVCLIAATILVVR